MSCRRVAAALGSILLIATAVCGEERSTSPPDLRLVTLREGLWGVSPDGDLSRMAETSIYRTAKSAGADLRAPDDPFLAQRYAEGRLFYVFYKTTENAFGDRPYLIQRIKKTERSWSGSEDTEPEVRTTYQVEVFKTIAGGLKRADQHYGSYGLRDRHRREIVKEYEVGFGEVPGLCEGQAWPYDPGALFKYLYKYGESREVYDQVVFHRSRPWTLTVSFDASGSYRVASPELGFDAPREMPDPEAIRPRPDAASTDVVLRPQQGLDDIVIGRSTAEDLRRVFDEPLEDAAVGRGHRNVSFRGALTFNLHPDGRLNTVITRPGFLGRTVEGVRHGDPRWRVMELMGIPQGRRVAVDAKSWRYEGILFAFDGLHRVNRIVVFRR